MIDSLSESYTIANTFIFSSLMLFKVTEDVDAISAELGGYLMYRCRFSYLTET